MKKLLIPALVLFCGLPSAHAQQGSSDPQLQYVMIVARHGVRAPTWTPERLNQYSAQPWPDFKVPPGFLTERGRELMKILGGFYREKLAAEGLLGKPGCSDVPRTYFWADTDQRTLESAKAMAEGLLPGCKAEIHSAPEGTTDPLFDPIEAGVVKPDPVIGLAAVKGSIGPDLNAVIDAHRPALDLLNHVLVGSGKAQSSIFDPPISLSGGDAGAAMEGPLRIASTFTENLLLEYTNGMSGDELGWGRLNPSTLLQVMSLHTAYADLMRRTPYLARARGSNLMSHIVRSLEQAVSGNPVAGSLATPNSAVVMVSGHDTNISNISGLLGLSWVLPSYQTDDAPPGGAVVFSLWKSAGSSDYSVRLQFIAQTMDQMHRALPLSTANPPVIANIFVPGCSSAKDGYPCSWPDFQRTLQQAIDPAFVDNRK